MGPVRPVIDIFLHDLCIINPQNDPKSPSKVKIGIFLKKNFKKPIFYCQGFKLYKVSSFKIFFKN